jgi:hypothetical protein
VSVCSPLPTPRWRPDGHGPVTQPDNWTDTTKWSGGVIADGTDAIADFTTIDITAARTATINNHSRTWAQSKFSDNTAPLFNYTIAASGGAR